MIKQLSRTDLDKLAMLDRNLKSIDTMLGMVRDHCFDVKLVLDGGATELVLSPSRANEVLKQERDRIVETLTYYGVQV